MEKDIHTNQNNEKNNNIINGTLLVEKEQQRA